QQPLGTVGLLGGLHQRQVDDDAAEAMREKAAYLVDIGWTTRPSQAFHPAQFTERGIVALRIDQTHRIAELHEPLGDRARREGFAGLASARYQEVHARCGHLCRTSVRRDSDPDAPSGRHERTIVAARDTVEQRGNARADRKSTRL